MVPYQKEGEEKIVFQLSARELAWLASAIIVSFMLGATIFTVLKLSILVGFIISLLLAVPVLAGAAFMAFNKVKHSDHYVTRDKHLWLCLKYRFEPKEYYNYRRNIVIPIIEEEDGGDE